MKYSVIAAVAILCLLSVILGTIMVTRKRDTRSITVPPQPLPTPPLPTDAPTTTIPPPSVPEPSLSMEAEEEGSGKKIHNTIVIYDALGRPYYPTVYEKYRYGISRGHPHYYYPTPLEPGGSFPDLKGMDKDKAVSYVLQTYPNLHVATVRYGQALPKDVRMDRMLIVYDAWSNLVIEAHIT